MDSDDWLELNMYEILIEAARQTKVDTVCCDAYDVTDNRIAKNIWNEFKENGLLIGRDKCVEAIISKSGPLWNKLLSSSCVGNHRFHENVSYGEDVLFLAEYLLDTDSALLINTPLYNYRCTRAGNVVSAKLDGRSVVFLSANQQIYDLMKENRLIETGFKRVMIAVYEIIKRIQDIKRDHEVILELRKLSAHVIKDKKELIANGTPRKQIMFLQLLSFDRCSIFLRMYKAKKYLQG